MSASGIEFSQFNGPVVPTTGDIIVGLRNGLNYQFNYSASSSTSTAVVNLVFQASHGFIVGNIVYFNGTQYVLAKADTAADAEVIGVVSSVVDNNYFNLLTSGYFNTLSGLVPGSVYFLSDSTAGALSTTEPSTPNHISKPLLIATSNTGGFFFNWRGKIVPSSSGSWQTVSTATQMVSGVNYIVNGGTVAFTLPTTAAIGDIMEIAGYNNTWSVAQNAGQEIQFGVFHTTLGTGGSLTSTLMGDCIRLLCTVANTNWLVLSETGNITYV